jgi:hypothetical protein
MVVVMVVVTRYNDGIKVIENEKSGKPVPCPPEWIRHPTVQIGVVIRRDIIADNRGIVIGIIVFDRLRAGVRTRFILRSLRRLARTFLGPPCGSHIEIHAGADAVEHRQCFVRGNGKSAEAGRATDALPQFSKDIRRHRVVGYPPVAGLDAN